MDWLAQLLGGGGFAGGGQPYLGAGISGQTPAEFLDPSLGQSLEPIEQPNAPPPGVQPQTQTGTGQQPIGRANPLVEALRGIKAPPPPDVIKPQTPPPPRLTAPRGGEELIQMLLALGSAPRGQGGRQQGQGLGQLLRG